MSCMMSTMFEKAMIALELYLMDRNSPETICKVRVIPSRNPMFHRVEIEAGVGRSIKDFLRILVIGFDFMKFVFILKGSRYSLLWVEGYDGNGGYPCD